MVLKTDYMQSKMHMAETYFEDEIEDFIELMQRAVPNSLEVFTKGNCGPFALILAKAFPGGEIKELISMGHVIYEYKGSWYDITGKLGNDYMKNNKLKYSDALELFSEYGAGKAMVFLRGNYKQD